VVDIKEIAENIYLIDNQLYSIPRWGSIYLINEARKALIDTGPTTSAKVVLEAVKQVGLSPQDIDYLILTHIHLDHAGGAGALIQDMPGAQVVVHYKGARHLVDPRRLVDSVIATQGERWMGIYGEVVPIDESKVMPVRDNEVIELSPHQTLRLIETPGHASHEICIHESRSNGLFAGDAVGVSVAEHKAFMPVTPPPSFNLDVYLDTMDKLKALKADTLYFAHFGASDQVEEYLQLAKDRLRNWDGIMSAALAKDGLDLAAEKLREQICQELEPLRKMGSIHRYLTEDLVPLNVAGFVHHQQKKLEAA
jgi:glyoxylase-like metal-dependent hydrolase (beta-lactamase superfamily II)